jgi:hypothetical protein
MLGGVQRTLTPMSLDLPPAIDLYVKAENSGNVEALSECFAPDATVHDESRTYRGLDAIKAWKVETKQKYNHRVEPRAIARKDGRAVLTAELAGNFPGSPVTLQFTFVLAAGKIASLEIH